MKMSGREDSSLQMRHFGKSGSEPVNKHYYMKQFIDAASDYIRTRTEDSGSLIKRHLQILSVTIDISIFDPNTTIVCEFFVSLHELLSNLEPRSILAWLVVEVLSMACKNNAARHQLIHTYEFVPILSRLLCDNLSDDKKIRLLSVMQELSYGMKISWQIPNLNHLISTLTNWIIRDAENENQNEQVTVLALGVLVNLCYNNLPGIYTLSRCVDIKAFLRYCSKLKVGSRMEMNIVKLIIILEHDHGFVPEDTFLKLINVTFKTLREAFLAHDNILLRHIVDFFLDIKKQNEKSNVNIRDIILRYEYYAEDVQELLKVVSADSGDASQQDPECVSSIFRFITSLIDMKLPNLVHLYLGLAKWILNWINIENASCEALVILKTILINSNFDNDLCNLMLSALPTFLSNLQNLEQDTTMNIEFCNRLSSVLQLLRVLVMVDSTRNNVLLDLKFDLLYNIFLPALGEGNQTPEGETNNYTPEVHSLLVNALVLIYEISKYKQEWVSQLSAIFEQRKVQAILAQCLLSSNQNTKALILSMAAFPFFPTEQISKFMYELQPVLEPERKLNRVDSVEYNLRSPTLSIIQTEKLDEALAYLKKAYSENQFVNMSTSNVIELYEYKLISMGHAERAARASIDAASQRCMHLQHQVMQLTAEIAKTRQLFIKSEQCTEELRNSNKNLEENNRDLINKLEAEKGRVVVSKSQVATLEKALHEKDQLIAQYSAQNKELAEQNKAQEENVRRLSDLVQKLKDNLHKQERNSEKKDELIKSNNSTISNMKIMIQQLGNDIKQKDLEIQERDDENKKLEKELSDKTDLINTITRLTTSRK